MSRLARGCCALGLLLLLAGCTVGAQVHLGDVTLGWNQVASGIHAVGSHVAIAIH